MTIRPLLRLLMPAWAGSVLLTAASCAQPPSTASYPTPPVPAKEARVWFYRDLAPYEKLATPYVRLNSAVAGVSQPGGAFYRDVPPGHYHISADSYGVDSNQTQDVDLAPGAEIFAKVIVLDNLIQGGGGGRSSGYRRDTFYVWLYPPDAARAAIAQSWFYGNGTLTAALPPR